MRDTAPIQPVPLDELESALKWTLNDLYGPLQRLVPDAARRYCPESEEGHEWDVRRSATAWPMTAQIVYRCSKCGASVVLDMTIEEAVSADGERVRTVTIREAAKLPGLEQPT